MRSLESELPYHTNVTMVKRPCNLLWHCYLAEKKISLNVTVAVKLSQSQFIVTSLLAFVFPNDYI